MTEKTLPEIYREAANLVLADGKIEGQYAKTDEAQCYGYCTMGAVFRASGDMLDDYVLVQHFDGSEAQTRLIKPIADQIVSSGRCGDATYADDNSRAWDVVQRWNDLAGKDKPSAEDVATLLNEVADKMEANA